MKKRKKILLAGLIGIIIGCSSKNNDHLNGTDLNSSKITENNIKEKNNKNKYLKSITYSNLADETTQNEIREILKKSGISSENINLFFQSVSYYNNKTENKDLIKSGFIDSQNINPVYDETKIQKLWDKNSPDFVGFNCRITAFTLMKDFIVAGKPLTKSGEMLFMDIDSLASVPFKLFSQTEKEAFLNIFTEIQTEQTKYVSVHVKNIQETWKKRGVKFNKGSKASLISVFFHFNDMPSENILFIGHVGVLISEENGSFIFVEKLAFQQPYQVLKFNNRVELNDYLMNKYDTAWGQPTAKPFIMENDELLKGYRINPNNK